MDVSGSSSEEYEGNGESLSSSSSSEESLSSSSSEESDGGHDVIDEEPLTFVVVLASSHLENRCHGPDEGHWISVYWFNDESVQKALHIRKGTAGIWIRCKQGRVPFKTLIRDVRPYHANLSTKGYRSLIYSGDHDMFIPFQSTQSWIRELNYSIVDDWRPWIVEGQFAGYTRSYSNKMTFATVKGGGHTAPEYKPAECYAMFERWISDKPL